MAKGNKVPREVLWEIHKRSAGRCEVCKSWSKNHYKPHHLVKRRHMNHRPEAQVDCCIDCHNEFEDDRSESGLHHQFRLALQKFYFEVFEYSEKKVRELMGGRLFLGDIKGDNGKKARKHFEIVERWMRQRGQIPHGFNGQAEDTSQREKKEGTAKSQDEG